MSIQIIATNSVPVQLKEEFAVDKVVNCNGFNVLNCVSEENGYLFHLLMFGGTEEVAPTLHIKYFSQSKNTWVTKPVYPFVAAEMPERVQGLINMAEQWLVYLDTHSF